MFDHIACRADDFFGETLDQGIEQFFLREEVIIEAALRNSGALDDVGNGGFVVALGEKKRGRAIDQLALADFRDLCP